MDPNLRKAIQDFKIKNNAGNGCSTDSVELEKCLREFKTELFIKRNEVNQLRTQLDAANLELQNLRKALDAAKKVSDENQFNVSFQLKKARKNEEELQEKRESLMKIQLQHKMGIAEVDTLKQNLQKTEMEKTELSRKLDVFEAKQRQNSLYHNEILKRDNHIRNFIGNITETVAKLRTEQSEAIELSKNTQHANEALEQLKICASRNEKLRKNKEKFEEMYIRINAKYEKLEKLMTTDSSINKPNLATGIVLNQWKLIRSHYQTEMRQKNEILDKITEHFTNEKTTNIELVRENDNIKDQNKKLEEENRKLKELSEERAEKIKILNEKVSLLEVNNLAKENDNLANTKQCGMEIKEETIEIDD